MSGRQVVPDRGQEPVQTEEGPRAPAATKPASMARTDMARAAAAAALAKGGRRLVKRGDENFVQAPVKHLELFFPLLGRSIAAAPANRVAVGAIVTIAARDTGHRVDHRRGPF